MAVADELGELLCDEERARAERLVSERRRRLWTRSRGVLRALLGRYLQRDPITLRFMRGAHGKPALIAGGSGSPVAPSFTAKVQYPSFNLSHSGQLALFAVAATGPVGVDVEVARRPINELAIAARTFGAEEARRLGRLDPVGRQQEFLRAWTGHEAALKCRGSGFGGSNERPRGLWIAELEVGVKAAGAVALERPARGLYLFDWH